MTDLRQSLLDYLAQAPELATSELGTPARLVFERAAEPVFPYLQIGRFLMAVPDEPDRGSVTLTCVSRYGGKAEAQSLVSRVRDALFGAQIALDDGHLAALRVTFSDVVRAADWRQTYGLVRVLATLSAPELRIAA